MLGTKLGVALKECSRQVEDCGRVNVEIASNRLVCIYGMYEELVVNPSPYPLIGVMEYRSQFTKQVLFRQSFTFWQVVDNISNAGFHVHLGGGGD